MHTQKQLTMKVIYIIKFPKATSAKSGTLEVRLLSSLPIATDRVVSR